jgi:hypothetical protein
MAWGEGGSVHDDTSTMTPGMNGFGEIFRALTVLLWLALCLGVVFVLVTLQRVSQRLAAMAVVPVLVGIAVTYGKEAWAGMAGMDQLWVVVGLLVGIPFVMAHFLWPGLCTAVFGNLFYDLLRSVLACPLRLLAAPFRLIAVLWRRLPPSLPTCVRQLAPRSLV